MTGIADTELVLTKAGLARLEAEHEHLATVKRPAAVDRLRQAVEMAGDLADNSEYLDARGELDRIEERIDVLEERLRTARVLRPREARGEVVSRGMRVVLEDLDDETVERYLVVASAESDPMHGRISDESPVGRAVVGRRKGDVVEARTPHQVRRLRIADVRAGSGR